MTPNIDLGKLKEVSKELAQIKRLHSLVVRMYKDSTYGSADIDNINRQLLHCIIADADAIAATLLKLAAENEERRKIGNDMWTMITPEQRHRLNMKYEFTKDAANKGDPA